MDNLSAFFPGPEELDSAPETSTLFKSSVLPGPSTVFPSISNYPKNDLQQVFKAVLEAQTLAVTALLLDDFRKKSLKTRFPDIY